MCVPTHCFTPGVFAYVKVAMIVFAYVQVTMIVFAYVKGSLYGCIWLHICASGLP